MTVPNVSYRVEIAWSSNWRTAAVDRVWTDVSAYVELQDGIGIDYGRSDEVSTADANTLSLTLDNTDGRFTWGNASSPYSPNVKVGRPIRVTAIVGASEFVRFTGYVNDWPVEWPGDSTTYAKATITASSRLSRLGLQAPLGSPPDAAARVNDPAAYYALGEPAGSTSASDTSGNASPSLVPAGSPGPTFGTAFFGEDSTGVTSPADGYGLTSSGWTDTPAAFTLSAFVIAPSPPPGPGFLRASIINFRGVLLYIDDDGQIHAEVRSGSTLAAGGQITGGDPHHVALTWDGTTMNLYVDGGTPSSDTGLGPAWLHDRLRVGGGSAAMTIQRVGVFHSALTAEQVASIAEAGLTGYLGDTTDERLQRYATWGRIPAAEVATTASPITLTAAQATEAQVESLMRQVETAEAGVLYDDRSGNLVLKPRSARYSAPVALTVPFSEDRVSGYQPKVDRQGLANVGTGKSSSGAEVTYTNEASREEYGDHEYSVETTALDPGEPLQLAAWQVNRNAEPRPRVPAPSLSVIDWLDSGDLAALLGLDIGSLLRLTGAPSQAPNATSADYFVEGYAEEIGVGTWTLSPNLTPVTLEDDVLILDSATDGVLDSNVLAL